MTQLADPVQIFNLGIVTGFYGIILLMMEFIYLVFAFIMLKQVKHMTRSFSTPLDGGFRLLALLNFVGTLIVMGMTTILL